MDVEFEIRKEAMQLLDPWFEMEEESVVKLVTGRTGRVDVLARPLAPELQDCFIAFEMKLFDRKSSLGAWIKQSADYVGGQIGNDWPPIVASFLWLYRNPYDITDADKARFQNYMSVAAHFRVGAATHTTNNGINLSFHGGCILRTNREGWTANARTLLFCKRQEAGTKRKQKFPLESPS